MRRSSLPPDEKYSPSGGEDSGNAVQQKVSSCRGIKWTIPLLLVVPVLVVATVLTVLAFTTGKRTSDDLANQNMQQIDKRIEEHLTRLLDLRSFP